MRAVNFSLTAIVIVTTCALSLAQGPSTPAPNFPLLELWRNAVLAGDAAALRSFYSTDPATRVRANASQGGIELDTNFWLGLKAHSMEISVIRHTNPQPNVQHFLFKAEIESGLPGGKTVTVANDQVWREQAGQWKLVSVTRVDNPHLKQPADMKKDIYPADADAHADLEAAERQAAKGHKRVLLVFGANWCYDCHVLDLAFQRPDIVPVLAAGYELVHVDLGPDEHKNADLVKQYAVPLEKGVPALVVAESDGTLVVSQKNGEFENARALTPADLLDFLERWAPNGQGTANK